MNKRKLLSKEKILEILEDIDIREVYRIALENQNKGTTDGKCYIDLKNGEIYGASYNKSQCYSRYREPHKALIFTIYMTKNFPEEDYLTKKEIKGGVEVTNERIIDDWEYHYIPLDWDNINLELESIYGK